MDYAESDALVSKEAYCFFEIPFYGLTHSAFGL